MAYEKQTWTTGEVITQEKLNHMEDGIANAGGGGDAGYECEGSSTLIYEGTVEGYAEPTLNPFTPLATPTSDTLTVTFDGTEYLLPKIVPAEGVVIYGEISGQSIVLTNYPCGVVFQNGSGSISCVVGTHQVKMEEGDITVTTSSCFKRAVRSILPEPDVFTVRIAFSAGEYTADKSYEEVKQAVNGGKLVLAYMGKPYTCTGIGSADADREYIGFETSTYTVVNGVLKQVILDIIFYYSDGEITTINELLVNEQ